MCFVNVNVTVPVYGSDLGEQFVTGMVVPLKPYVILLSIAKVIPNRT